MAFLDVMASGLGAVVLLFLIVKHHAGTAVEPEAGAAAGAAEAGTPATLAGRIDEAQRRRRRMEERRALEIRAGERRERREEADRARLADVEREIERSRARNAALRKEVEVIDPDRADDIIEDIRVGEEDYLLGLKVEGRRIAILIDRSASMTDEQLIDIIVRKIRPDAEKRRGPKWRRAFPNRRPPMPATRRPLQRRRGKSRKRRHSWPGCGPGGRPCGPLSRKRRSDGPHPWKHPARTRSPDHCNRG